VGTHLSQPVAPNRLWCADYKGEFLLTNHRYCYPLTITDFASRFLLACEALSTTKERYAFTVFERAFQEWGLPDAIRTDNGVPFASAHALYGLSKLAVWWLRLGIALERIAPGHPEQNGRHERLHLTLKNEATRPAGDNVFAATGALRHVRPPVQPRAAASGARDGDAGQPLSAVRARLPRRRRARIPRTTGRPSSRPAAASATKGAKSISARSLPGRKSACARPTTTSGS
jgi:hypothetical protein